MDFILHGKPEKCTRIIAFVFFEIFFSILFSSIFKVSGFMSTRTGLAPTSKIEFIVEQKVRGVVITSSPAFMPKTFNDRWSPAVH